ncbi:cold shock domain-containing protein [Bacteroidales bacterium OttesenSCG-928-I21]|nr:cold shock domain-containing protein [Bacteroidales bacterium OttesenSCG-928-I21]
MARPATFNKKDNEKKKQTKRLEKQKKKEERKISGKSSFDDMIAYVDENGMITSTPPDMQNKEKIQQEDIQISVPKKESVEAVVYKGRIEHFNDSKGYGFIKDLAGADKYFFHISNAPDDVAEGNIYFFDLQRGNKGMNAVNIRTEE